MSQPRYCVQHDHTGWLVFDQQLKSITYRYKTRDEARARVWNLNGGKVTEVRGRKAIGQLQGALSDYEHERANLESILHGEEK